MKNSLKDKEIDVIIKEYKSIILKYPEIYQDFLIFGEEAGIKTFQKCIKKEEKLKHQKKFTKKLNKIIEE